MNDKKERYISSELSDKTQLSVLRSIVGWGYEKIRHSLGRPGQLLESDCIRGVNPVSFKNSCRYTMDAIGDLLAGLDIPIMDTI